ncbi:unnamed protein product [Danaus chrysippus]|uniref:(African queen) hypothetical protein n=1 Tax=Danaus chrysippus TaxID=151541 RepID=A0A8J2QQC8_9NEOP|nr:unnamed protein product [Danaus chrysippus]
MLRGLRILGPRGSILEPYVSSLRVSCNYTSAQPSVNLQKLPQLPVPKLNDTLKKYLKSVQPFLNEEELAKTSSLLKEFEAGVGFTGKKELKKHLNWLEDWWLNTAYLEYRDPVTVYSSPGLVFPFQKFNSQQDQLKYAAKTILAALEYKSLIDKYSMLMYGEVITKRLNENQIVEALQKVMDQSAEITSDCVGVLTSENRDNWAKAYQLLCKESVNQSSLRDVERSLLVLCLDKSAGLWRCSTVDERFTLAAAHTIHGAGADNNGANRWFDKTIQTSGQLGFGLFQIRPLWQKLYKVPENEPGQLSANGNAICFL